jgi:Fe-S cluster assembly protein SufD
MRNMYKSTKITPSNPTLPSVDQLDINKDLIPLAGVKKSIAQYRLHAWEVFKKLPMPDRRMPSWRRTDLHGLNPAELSFAPSSNGSQEVIEGALLKGLSGRISISPENTKIELGEGLARQKVVLSGLLEAEREYPQLLEAFLGKIVPAEDGKISALTNALANFGAFIHVPKGIQVPSPVLCDLSVNTPGKANFSHVLIQIGEGASLTLLVKSSSRNRTSRQSLHAGNVEIVLEKNSKLKFIELQDFDSQVWNLTQERALLSEKAELEWIFGVLGSQLTKSSIEVSLNGEGSRAKSSGFYFSNLNQHFDLDTRIQHKALSTTSNFVYKGVLLDQSRSVWQGMIYVAPEAVKTDGYQGNQNLLLSHQARADSIPALEILADDVQCSHGATVGSLDPDQLFYLESRGISQQDAEKLIVEGFFAPILEKIEIPEIYQDIYKVISSKLERNE